MQNAPLQSRPFFTPAEGLTALCAGKRGFRLDKSLVTKARLLYGSTWVMRLIEPKTGGPGNLLQATVTPLASIFGSGFLVVLPVLASAAGPYSVVAIAAVLVLAYGVGGVIRHNITVVEPALAKNPPRAAVLLERLSAYALILAYVLSICLYLHILAAFALKPFEVDTAFNKSLLVTVIILGITVLGIGGGLKPLEALEKYALCVTLLIVALLLFAFARYDFLAVSSTSGLVMPEMPDRTPWEIVTIVAGALIIVQGFETTRYTGASYDAPTRAKASRLSQVIASIVYLSFVALGTPLLAGLNGRYDVNSLFGLSMAASVLLPIPLVVAATMSQFSAAVADTVASVGGIRETSRGRIASAGACIGVAAGTIVLAWSGNTFTVVAWASRAFALYYLLQCLVAFTICPYARRKIWISLVAIGLVFVTLFAVPAG